VLDAVFGRDRFVGVVAQEDHPQSRIEFPCYLKHVVQICRASCVDEYTRGHTLLRQYDLSLRSCDHQRNQRKPEKTRETRENQGNQRKPVRCGPPAKYWWLFK
jgi:hypothetical protein